MSHSIKSNPDLGNPIKEQAQETYCGSRRISNPPVSRYYLPDHFSPRLALPSMERECAVIIEAGEFRHMEEILVHIGGGMSPRMESEYLAGNISEAACKAWEQAIHSGRTFSKEGFVRVYDIAKGTLLGEICWQTCLGYHSTRLVRRLWTPPYEKFHHMGQFLGWYASAIPGEIGFCIIRRKNCPCCLELASDVVTELEEVRWGYRPWDDSLLPDTQIELWDMYFGKESTFPEYVLGLVDSSPLPSQSFEVVSALRDEIRKEKSPAWKKSLYKNGKAWWQRIRGKKLIKGAYISEGP